MISAKLRWFNVHQAAEFIGLDRATVTRLVDNGTLPSTILPGSIRWRRIHRRDLLAYAKQLELANGGRR